MLRAGVLMAMLLWVAPATWAWDFVCTGVRPQCAGTTGLTRYLRGLDVGEVTDPACTAIPDEPYTLTQDQRALVATVAASHANGRCHLKVVEGLAVEMDAGEKGTVNAAIAADEADQQAYVDAVTDNNLCNATLTELETAKTQLQTNLQGDIDGISNIATAKTELADMMQRLTNALEQILKCVRGRAGR